MSEPNHLKCPCLQCGGSIEFPANGVGQAAICPHCGSETTLFAANASEPSDGPDAVADAPSSSGVSFDSGEIDGAAPALNANESADDQELSGSKWKLLWITLPLLGLAGLAAFLVFKGRVARPQAPASNENSVATNLNAAKTTGRAPTNVVAASTAPKSIDDLKVGPIKLEKSKGSSLVYAVGVMRNDSGHQRFGVNLELELADARGNKAGIAKDYRAVIEPRQEWRFRALVLDSKAVSAKVAAIREEE